MPPRKPKATTPKTPATKAKTPKVLPPFRTADYAAVRTAVRPAGLAADAADPMPSDDELKKLLDGVGSWAVATDTPPAAEGRALALAAARFTEIPIVSLGNGLWRLGRDVEHQDGTLGCTLFARRGYEFDLASVPRVAWPVIAPFELSILAPLFHDLLYEFKGRPPAAAVRPYRTFTRQEADDLFLRLMTLEGVSGWRRALAYTAVRAAGWTYWNT
jgi:hypothetical protein